tara:strand:- start:15539 stop:19306 length:3768 start_codon:yes stop_codon:yes gene_type:complete
MTPTTGEESTTAEKATPSSDYRFITDRAFDPLAADAEPSQQGATVTVDELISPADDGATVGPNQSVPVSSFAPEPQQGVIVTETAPEDLEVLFPAYIEPNSPKAPVTPVASADPVEIAQPVAVATAQPASPSTPTATASAKKTPPLSTEDLTFPLTLDIPGYDPNAPRTPPSGEDSNSNPQGSMDYQNQVATKPLDPLLNYSAPATLGVGASLAGDESDLYLDALVPFWQSNSGNSHTIAFLVPRISRSREVMTNGSLGLGFRSLQGEGSLGGDSFPWIIGANVFYDFTHAVSNNDYNQFGMGIEWMSPFMDFRINGYLPESTENKVAENSQTSRSTSSSSSSSTSYGSLYASGNRVLQPYSTTTTTTFRQTTTTQYFEQYERALKGFDGEAGLLIPVEYTFIPVRFYGGYYSFENPYGEDITGPKARVEIRPFSFLLLDASWYQDEELLGSNWFLGARAEVTIGGNDPATPSSSKPAYDTSEGPKTEAYNPYAGFRSRMVERIPRNYQSVLTLSPFMENLSLRQTSVSTYSSSSTETGQITIASQIIFVDAARGALTGAGTWESPFSTIQGGADLAIANLGSTGSIWTVWTQGGVGPYSENVTVTGSVNFTSNAIPITGQGGQTFGGGAGPIVQGGFLFGTIPAGPASPTIARGSVRGYEITGGHTAASFAGITFVNVEVADASNNRIDTIGGTGIEVINTGATEASGTFASNGIFNTGGDAIHFNLSDTSQSTYSIQDSGFENLATHAVRVDATDSATYDVAVTRSSATGLSTSALYLNADTDSSGSISATNSQFDGGGVDADITDSANASLTVSGTSFENDPDSVFTLTATGDSNLESTIQNNVLQDNQSGLALSVTGSSVSTTTFSGNSVSNNTTDAVSAEFDSSGTQEFTVSGNEISATDGDAISVRTLAGTADVTISNNTIDTATNRGILVRSSQTSSVTALVSGNGTTQTSGGGIHIRSSGSSNMDSTVQNNVISNSGDYGVRIQGSNASLSSNIVQGNTISETVAAAIDIIGANNSIVAVLAQANAIADITTTGIQAVASNNSNLSLNAFNNNITNTTQEGILFTGQDNSSSRFEARSNLIASVGNASGIQAAYLGNHNAEVIIANNIIGPTAQQGLEINTSDSTTADITISGNGINDSSQDAIRMVLYSTEDQTVSVYSNNLQRTGAHGVNLSTQGPKQVSVYSNQIGTTGGAAVRAKMESGGLVLSGSSAGNNVYTDPTPVPFDSAGTAPYTGGDGVLINNVVYP